MTKENEEGRQSKEKESLTEGKASVEVPRQEQAQPV